MKKLGSLLVSAALVAVGLVANAAAPAAAAPQSLSPANGTSVAAGAQQFSWGETHAQGALWNYYVEISTSPAVDYYPYGYFSGGIVFTSGDLSTNSVNLNAVGRALAPGTYYWHVLGKYGLYGAGGTYWSGVQSVIVRGAAAVPVIGLNPSTVHFTVVQGDTLWTEYGPQVALSNTGTGAVTITATPSGALWLSQLAGTNDGTIQMLRVAVCPHPPATAVNLPPGEYSSYIRMTAPGAVTRDLTITMTVVAADSAAPTSSSVSSSSPTRTGFVTLNLFAADSGSGMGYMRFRNGAGAWSAWQDYATTKQWQLDAGQGVHTIGAQFADLLGNTANEVTTTAVLDSVAPGKPTLTAPATSTTASSAAAVALRWTAASDPAPSSGLAGYRVYSRALPATAWTAWGGTRTGTAASFPATPGTTYQFLIRSIDRAGNLSATSAVATSVVPFDQASATFAGSWTTVADAVAYRGSLRRSTAHNAAASLRATGRTFGVLVRKGPARGKVAVYVDGVLVTTIDTRTAAVAERSYVAVKTFAVAAAHTVRVVVLGTAGRPAVDLDGIVVGR